MYTKTVQTLQELPREDGAPWPLSSGILTPPEECQAPGLRDRTVRSAQTRFLRDQIQHLIGADDAVARPRAAAVAVPTTRHTTGLARPHLANDPLDFRPRHSMSHAYVAKYVLDGLGGHDISRSTRRRAAAAAIIDCRGGVDYVLLKSPWEFLRVAMTILRGRGG